MADWYDDGNWNIHGVHLAAEEALLYDLKTAKKPQPKGGWAVKRQKEAEEAAKAVETAEN